MKHHDSKGENKNPKGESLGIHAAVSVRETQPPGPEGWVYSSLDLSSFSLYMKRIQCLKTSRLGSVSRFTLMQFRSYHSMMPRNCCPSSSTTTMGVLFCICFR